MSKLSLSIMAVLVPGVATAHPEHFSGGAFGLTHFLTDPFHLGLAGAALLVFITALRAVRGDRARNRSSH